MRVFKNAVKLWKIKRKTFSLFTVQQLDSKISDYIVADNIHPEADISVLSEHGKEINELFHEPDIYQDGNDLKIRMQRLVELCFLRAVAARNTELQEALITLLYGFYKTMDSPDLQEGIIFDMEETQASEINQAKHDMLIYFYTFNAMALDRSRDEANYIHRINNQKRILCYFLSCSNLEILEQLEPQLTGNIQSQIFNNTYLETNFHVPEKKFSFKTSIDALSDEQKELFAIALKNDFSMLYFLKDIYDMDIPEHIGLMYIKALNDKSYLYDKIVLSETLPAEYKIYGLLRQAVIEDDNPFSLTYGCNRLLAYLTADTSDESTVSQETEKELAADAEKILNDASKRIFFIGDNYLDALEAEMLFAAAAVALHGKYSDVGLSDFLKQLKYTFVRHRNTEYIADFGGGAKAELFRIAMNGSEEYINSIKSFVESLYKRTRGEHTDGKEKGFVSVVKGHLCIIRTVKKSCV